MLEINKTNKYLKLNAFSKCTKLFLFFFLQLACVFLSIFKPYKYVKRHQYRCLFNMFNVTILQMIPVNFLSLVALV